LRGAGGGDRGEGNQTVFHVSSSGVGIKRNDFGWA
jgi:hypothetical protein